MIRCEGPQALSGSKLRTQSAGRRLAKSKKYRIFRYLYDYADLASQSSSPRLERGSREYRRRALTLPPFRASRPSERGLTRETIPPVSPFGVRGLWLAWRA